jgi:hypothetical protein
VLSQRQREILGMMATGWRLKSSTGDGPGHYHLQSPKQFWDKRIVRPKTFSALLKGGFVYLGEEYSRSAYLLTESGFRKVTSHQSRDDVESIEVASWMGIRDVRKNPEVDS